LSTRIETAAQSSMAAATIKTRHRPNRDEPSTAEAHAAAAPSRTAGRFTMDDTV
jgi:hypothetical protein